MSNKEPAVWSIDAADVMKALMDNNNLKANRIAQLEDELDCQEKATAFVHGHYDQAKHRIAELEVDHKHSELAHQQKNQRITTLEAMLDEAVAIFGRYLNVPESRDLSARWEKMKHE